MKVIVLKLKDDILEDAERLMKKTKVSRDAYIGRAVHCFNLLNKRHVTGRVLRASSKAVAANSLDLLMEMESLDPHLTE